MKERQTETEREKDRDRERDRATQREIEEQRERQRKRERQKERDRERHSQQQEGISDVESAQDVRQKIVGSANFAHTRKIWWFRKEEKTMHFY